MMFVRNHEVPAFFRLHYIELACGVVFILVFGVLVLLFSADRIQQDLQQRVKESLAFPGTGSVGIEINGRDLNLRGAVSSRLVEERVLETSVSTFGVRAVESALAIRPARLSHFRMFRDLQGTLRVEGELPSQSMADELAEWLAGIIQHDIMVNALTVNADAAEPHWYKIVPAVLREANWLAGIDMEIGAGSIVLGGLLDRQSDYNVLIKRVREFASSREMRFINRIGIRPASTVLPTAPVSSQ